jgi:hypothetical protein
METQRRNRMDDLQALTIRLLENHLKDVTAHRDAIKATIDRIENDPAGGDPYEGVLRSFGGGEQRHIMQGLDLLLAQAETAVAEATQAIALHRNAPPIT